MRPKFAKLGKPRRMQAKPVGSELSHLMDNRLTYAERQATRFINRTECRKIARLHDAVSARLQRRHSKYI